MPAISFSIASHSVAVFAGLRASFSPSVILDGNRGVWGTFYSVSVP